MDVTTEESTETKAADFTGKRCVVTDHGMSWITEIREQHKKKQRRQISSDNRESQLLLQIPMPFHNNYLENPEPTPAGTSTPQKPIIVKSKTGGIPELPSTRLAQGKNRQQSMCISISEKPNVNFHSERRAHATQDITKMAGSHPININLDNSNFNHLQTHKKFLLTTPLFKFKKESNGEILSKLSPFKLYFEQFSSEPPITMPSGKNLASLAMNHMESREQNLKRVLTFRLKKQ
jgi:hypothetical protein